MDWDTKVGRLGTEVDKATELIGEAVDLLESTRNPGQEDENKTAYKRFLTGVSYLDCVTQAIKRVTEAQATQSKTRLAEQKAQTEQEGPDSKTVDTARTIAVTVYQCTDEQAQQYTGSTLASEVDRLGLTPPARPTD